MKKLGYYEQASESYQKALVDLARLPDADDFRLQTAKIHNQLGYVHRMMGGAAKAKTYYENTTSDLKQLKQVDSETEVLRALELARSHFLLGHQVRSVGSRLFQSSHDYRPHIGIGR